MVRLVTPLLLCASAATLALAGCAQVKKLRGQENATPAPARTTAAAPVAPSGVNARGEVTDSSKVEAGQVRQVKGLGGWEGEITGMPARASKFSQLQIGIPMKQVTDLIGAPTDQGAYLTGKAWIPFYFGSDRSRYELVYKGQGRLIFSGEGGFSDGAGHLSWIIHNDNEPGYR